MQLNTTQKQELITQFTGISKCRIEIEFLYYGVNSYLKKFKNFFLEDIQESLKKMFIDVLNINTNMTYLSSTLIYSVFNMSINSEIEEELNEYEKSLSEMRFNNVYLAIVDMCQRITGRLVELEDRLGHMIEYFVNLNFEEDLFFVGCANLIIRSCDTLINLLAEITEYACDYRSELQDPEQYE